MFIMIQFPDGSCLPCKIIGDSLMPLLVALGEKNVSPARAAKDGRRLQFQSAKPLIETPVPYPDALKILAKEQES